MENAQNEVQGVEASAKAKFGGLQQGGMEGGINNLVTSARGEIGDMKNLAKDAFTSKAYLYPAKGFFYFLNHPDLWRPLWLRLKPSIFVSVVVTILMFFFTYVPQVFVFGIFNGPLALINVYFLVLSESAALSGAITKTMYLERGLVDIFDATLIERGSSDLVTNGRTIEPGGNVWHRLGHKLKAPIPKFKPANVIQYLMYLPLNFIPVVGTLVFLYLQGKKYGPPMHERYFQLKGMSFVERDAHVEQFRGGYTAFGIAAGMLEHLCAFTGIFFAFTNTVGAALWAHDIENHLSPTKGLDDLKAQGDILRDRLVDRLGNKSDFQDETQQAADQLAENLQAQFDQTVAGQVAQNLHVQTEALASGVFKGMPHM